MKSKEPEAASGEDDEVEAVEEVEAVKEVEEDPNESAYDSSDSFVVVESALPEIDWRQSPSHVTVVVQTAGIDVERIDVRIERREVHLPVAYGTSLTPEQVTMSWPVDGHVTVFKAVLEHDVEPAQSRWSSSDENVAVVLKKVTIYSLHPSANHYATQSPHPPKRDPDATAGCAYNVEVRDRQLRAAATGRVGREGGGLRPGRAASGKVHQHPEGGAQGGGTCGQLPTAESCGAAAGTGACRGR